MLTLRTPETVSAVRPGQKAVGTITFERECGKRTLQETADTGNEGSVRRATTIPIPAAPAPVSYSQPARAG